MRLATLSKAYSARGAGMGRSETHAEDRRKPYKFRLVKMVMHDGDYDEGGAYWGGPVPVAGCMWRAEAQAEDVTIQLFPRAPSREAAVGAILAEYPNAKFYQGVGKTYWYTSSMGLVNIQMTMDQARAMSHSGACDADVAAGEAVPFLKAQLDKIDPDDLRRELKEYGAWDADELADHATNLTRILWLAAGDITEEYDR